MRKRGTLIWILLTFLLLGQTVSAAQISSDGYNYGISREIWETRAEQLLKTVYLGEYNTSHLQGFAVDDELEYIYASFTTVLVKLDLQTGKTVGKVTGWTGHLGDLAYYDGRVYGSLEYYSAKSFYIAAFDCSRITGDVSYQDCMQTMYLSEVNKDHVESFGGRFTTQANPSSSGHAYGCTGIDGVAFGTIPGDDSGEVVMLVAYGIYLGTGTDSCYTEDRDYQVLLQFRLDSFLEKDGSGTRFKDGISGILDQSNYHRKDPAHDDKYFVYTGNTKYGVQNLEYDAKSGNYIMAVYQGNSPEFPNYRVYYVDGSAAPQVQTLKLGDRQTLYAAMPNENPGCTNMAQGKVLQLAQIGVKHAASGVWGSNNTGAVMNTGVEHLFGDFFYISTSGAGENGGQTGSAHLYRYDRQADTYRKVTGEFLWGMELCRNGNSVTLAGVPEDRNVALAAYIGGRQRWLDIQAGAEGMLTYTVPAAASYDAVKLFCLDKQYRPAFPMKRIQ